MKKTEDAVSPVIGVMLMLVITIIIAAVVSVFAGGVITSVETPAQTTFSVSSVIDTISDNNKKNDQPDQKPTGTPYSATNGIRFTVTGEETVFLEDLTIQLSNTNTQMRFTMRTVANESSYVRGNTSVLKHAGKNTYFSTGGVDYTELNAGDYFILLADSCYDSTSATDPAITKGKFLVWSPEDSKGTFTAQIGKDLQYSIIDTASGNVLQRGTVKL